MSMRERDIEQYLVKRVKEEGGEVRKVSWIGRRGAPDRLVMLPQRPWPAGPVRNGFIPPATIWVELKATGKKAEPHQLREHARMRNMGQRVVVVDSFEQVEDLLA